MIDVVRTKNVTRETYNILDTSYCMTNKVVRGIVLQLYLLTYTTERSYN